MTQIGTGETDGKGGKALRRGDWGLEHGMGTRLVECEMCVWGKAVLCGEESISAARMDIRSRWSTAGRGMVGDDCCDDNN